MEECFMAGSNDVAFAGLVMATIALVLQRGSSGSGSARRD
jgi:hypothetical protein